jgi:hypothetical protein
MKRCHGLHTARLFNASSNLHLVFSTLQRNGYKTQTEMNTSHRRFTALQTLPQAQMAALSFDVQSRQEALAAESDGLTRDASPCAIRTGNLGKATEFLEAGGCRTNCFLDVGQLEETITYYREALTLSPPGHLDRSSSINWVGWKISKWYLTFGSRRLDAWHLHSQ